jgi:hypothetical protein
MEDNRSYSVSQKTYNNGDNKAYKTKKSNNLKEKRNSISEPLKEPIPCPENYRKKFLDIVKDIDEDVGKGEKYNEFLIYTGVKDGFDKEIVLRIELLDDGFVYVRSGELFGIYLESKYSFKTASKMVSERVDRKNHKGLIGFDETDWSICGYCRIEEYPYVKWTITEVIEDMTWSCCE